MGNHLEFNAYCTGKNGDQLRAVMISGKWRITKYINSARWDFLDDIEYNTSSEALEKYI